MIWGNIFNFINEVWKTHIMLNCHISNEIGTSQEYSTEKDDGTSVMSASTMIYQGWDNDDLLDYLVKISVV